MVKIHSLGGVLKRFVFVGILLLLVSPGIIAYEEIGQSRLFTVEELQADFRQMSELMEKGHSILYKFTDKQAFDQFVEAQFAKIDKLEIKNLLLDLRNNGGGNPFCTSNLFSYLIAEPLPYFAEEYGKYARLASPIPPAEKAFHGRLIVLINGGCFSSTPHLCALLKYHKIGTFVGTEAGGTYTCNGAPREIKLSHTRFIAVVNRRSFAAAVDGFPDDRGILPDHFVMPRIEDLVQGRDSQKEYALQLFELFVLWLI